MSASDPKRTFAAAQKSQILPCREAVRPQGTTYPCDHYPSRGIWRKSIPMNKATDDWLDPKAKGMKTPTADYDRNRGGIYGGLPQARLDSNAEHEEMTEKTTDADFDRNRDGIYGGLPKVRLESEATCEKAAERITKSDNPTAK